MITERPLQHAALHQSRVPLAMISPRVSCSSTATASCSLSCKGG